MTLQQREFEVELPIGYTDGNGQIHRQAWLRKMRGHEEALLSDPAIPPGKLVTELLSSCLTRLGDVEEPGRDIVSQLYTADRNYLLVELRRVTLGDRLRESYLCPRCGVDVPVVEDLSAIEVRRLGAGEALEDIDVALEDGYVDREGSVHNDLVMRLPRGSDEEFVSPMVEKDPLKAQDALMLRCLKRFGSLPKSALDAYGVKILRDLTLGDRQRLRQVFTERAPGVNFERSIACGHCGTTFAGVMDVSNFFVLS